MSIVVVNSAEVALLNGTWSGLADDFELRLFTNDVTAGLTPSEIQDLDEGDFTEATFTGYAPVPLGSAGWTITAGNPTTGVHGQQSFTASVDQAPQMVRGYYVVDDTTGSLRWFEPFPAGPVVVEFEDDEIQITPTLTLDDREGNTVPVGEIVAFGGETPPPGWLLCDGSAVSRSTWPLLFAVLGESYGAGDGSTTFELPDLRQRMPMGVAESGTGSTLGETGGAVDHTHGLDTASSGALVRIAAGSTTAQRRKSVASWSITHDSNDSGSSDSGTSSSAAELIGDSDSANPPFQTVNWMIRGT